MLRVLHIDDEPDFLEICRIFLEASGEFTVDTALSVPEGLAKLNATSYDAIVSDYRMPGMDGIILLKTLRSQGSTLPFILFTGRGREEVVIEALNNGADFYLQKGTDMEEQFPELADKIRLAVGRRKAEELIRETSEYLTNLITNASVPIVVWDINFRITRFNRAFEKLTGFPEADVIGKDLDILFPDTSRSRSLDLTLRALFGEKWESAEIPIRTVSGETRTVIWNSANIYARDGTTLLATIAQGTDITERKRAGEALRENEARLDLALASAGMGVWQWDIQKNLRTFDRATCQLLGIDPDSFRGTADEFVIRVHPDDRGKLSAAMSRALEEDALYEPEYRAVWPDGSIHFLTARGKVVRDTGGKPVRVNGLLWDITRQKQLAEELRTSEEKYRRVLDTAEEGIWELDKNYLAVYVNPKLAAMLGYRPEEMLGKGMSRFMLKEDLADHALRMERRKKGYGDLYERRFVKKDGGLVWMFVSATALRDGEGNFNGSFTMVTDITQRKKVEENLRTSETRFRAIIQNTTDIIRILDKSGTIIFDSPASETILGYPPGYTVGKKPSEFIHPEDQERVRRSLKEVYDRKNSGRPTEFRVRKSDGTYLYVESVAVNLLGVPGVDGVIVTTRPIDERKRSEQAIRENQIRLANAMDLSRLVNWEFDIATQMFTFNDRFYTLYGTTAENEGGYTMSADDYARKFVYPDDLPHVVASIEDIAEITDPAFSRQIEHRIIRRDGEIRHIVVRFSVVIGENGRVTKTYGVNQDISEWKAIEEQLKRFNEELEMKVLERAGALQQALEEKTVLLQEIHHRVKNNLQIIVSLIRLQQRKVSDPSARNALRDSESRVRSMALVHEKLYRSEDVAHVNLTDYVNALVLSISNMYRIDPGRVKIITRLEMISLDIHQAIPLGLILNELVSNAFKYAFPGNRKGEIGIYGSFSGDHITIAIQDSGVGFPERFDWKNASTLGLHLVITLVEQLRGTITYTPGRGGTTFEISIPVQEQRGKS
ncbi:MAG: PAS domain S-box protein [Methanoregulaceae archaeon]